MIEKTGSVLYAQSGGPTAVINSSAYGVIKTALESDVVCGVYAAECGIKGVLEGKIFDLRKEDPKELEYLLHTPSSVFGSARYKLADSDIDDTDYKKILEVFKKLDIRYFFYNGGNDSMDTCNKISKYFLKENYECHVIGVPKTVDNDLFGTDHCPGYPSAAKYIATSIAEISRDARVYKPGCICVVEIMGRNAGWLTAAAALANVNEPAVDFIYLPERVFDIDKFLCDVDERYKATGNCVVAVSEGIRHADGSLVSEAKKSATDGFGHEQLGGLAVRLADAVKIKTGAKVRGIELSLLQRCAAHSASAKDIEEAFATGKFAMEMAEVGYTDQMITLKRMSDGEHYKCEPQLLNLADVANVEKKIPDEWINAEGNNVNEEFIKYALPLIQGELKTPTENGMPRFAKLKKELVEL